MTANTTSNRIQINVDLTTPGRHIGDLQIKWSDNRCPIGYYPVPVACLSNGEGPTVLLTGGVHGDEFEGPAVLMRLIQSLSIDDIQGRLILIPALNATAVNQSSRVSPLDGINMNRAFPGDPDGSPTQMLAYFVETVLLPQCDGAIDLHSGGKASVFASCTLAQIDGANGAENRALAEAFAAPFLWVSNQNNDNRSLNAAADRQGLTMIAAELGGGGGCDPEMTDFAESALKRCLNHLGLTGLPVKSGVNSELVTYRQTIVSPSNGLFDRRCQVGDRINAGQHRGNLHFPAEPTRESRSIECDTDGIVLAQTNRGMVERGDLLAMIATPYKEENPSS